MVNAEQLEQIGNWYLAGETYSKLAQDTAENADIETRAKLFTRAASCFEIAGQAQPAALAYRDAARLLSGVNLKPQIAGELLNRAAIHYRSAGEFFYAGAYWEEAAREFAKISSAQINFSDDRPPVRISNLKFFLIGSCYNAAGDAYARAEDYEIQACNAYWSAGNELSQPRDLPNIQSFNAYLKALKVFIQCQKTLELNELRRSLPLTEKERAAKLNPIATMEKAAFQCNYHHQSITDEAGRQLQAKLETDRLMSAAFHEFSVALGAVENYREAGVYRAAVNGRKMHIFWREARYSKAVLYYIWKVTSNYGASLGRWIIACSVFIIIFAAIFFSGGLISPSAVNPDEALINSLYFSWLTFTSFGYSDNFYPLGFFGKLVSSIEIAIGLFMFGVLLSFLGSRIQRT